jgi:hypothetical protein
VGLKSKARLLARGSDNPDTRRGRHSGVGARHSTARGHGKRAERTWVPTAEAPRQRLLRHGSKERFMVIGAQNFNLVDILGWYQRLDHRPHDLEHAWRIYDNDL